MRMWEIRANSEYPKYGRRSSKRGYKEDSDEAYECGYEDGYRAAMKEAKRYEESKDSYRRY